MAAFYDMKILPYFDLPSRLKRDRAFLGKCGLVINSHDLAGQKVSSRAFCFPCLDKYSTVMSVRLWNFKDGGS